MDLVNEADYKKEDKWKKMGHLMTNYQHPCHKKEEEDDLKRNRSIKTEIDQDIEQKEITDLDPNTITITMKPTTTATLILTSILLNHQLM